MIVKGGKGTEILSLTELSDVDITSVANLNLLQYNSSSGEWENKTLAQIADSRYYTETEVDDLLAARDTFIELTDTPASYSGQSLKGVRVNVGETALEFYTTVTDTDEKVGIDSDATAGYLGASSSIGVLRTGSNLSYADGGDFVTLDVNSTKASNWDSAFSHVSDDGSSHADVVTNTAKVTESTTVSAPLSLSIYDISIPVADTNTDGYLSQTDWDTFNSKQSALPVADTQTIIKGSADATKLIRFEIDGLATETTRVLTVPDKDITIADNDDIPTVSDTAYNATTWDANTNAATKNAIRDKVETMNTAIDLNTTHRGSNGTDHSYIDQSVVSGASPTFAGANFTSLPTVDKHDDVDTTTDSPSRDETLKWNGSNWVPAAYDATFEFTIASFTDNESTPQEIGSGNWRTAVGSDLSFDMTYNNGPATSGFVSIGGTGSVSWSGGNLVLTDPFTTQIQNIDDTAYPASKDTSIVFTLDATSGADNDTDTETVWFYNRIRWGKSSTSTGWSSADIVALAGSAISNDHTRGTMAITSVGASDYLIFACPANYSNLTSVNFSYNNLIVNIESAETISVTNDSGFQENYEVYRSTLQNLGNYNLQSNESTAQNYFFYGGSTTASSYSEADVEGLTDVQKPITNDTTQTFNEVTLGASEYFVFAYPSRLTDPTNWFDNSTGFPLAMFSGSPETLSITNENGYTENYDVWRSENILGPGTFTLRTS